MAGSIDRLIADEEAAIDSDMAMMMDAGGLPPMEAIRIVHASTDIGNSLELKKATANRDVKELNALEFQILSSMQRNHRLIRLFPASDDCNCHGWVFTGGKHWLGPDAVARILSENGYVPVSDPRVGDLAIYRTGEMISHTAVVSAVTPGRPVLVEGKWGWMGVFIHAVDDSSYGPHFTYYRSSREGHLLAGLTGNGVNTPPAADMPPRGMGVE
jgi:hypothetical protein